MDPFAVEVGNGEVATVVFAVGDALGDALVRPGRVVMRMVLGQDGAQVALAEFTRRVSRYEVDEPRAERVHSPNVRGFTTLPMRDAVTEAAARVREGAPIGRSLAASRLFPPMTIHLISSGESSGQLESMLERAAISQERELDGLLAALVGLLGPLLIVFMGLFVMGIVFAMLLPIFEINQLIH